MLQKERSLMVEGKPQVLTTRTLGNFAHIARNQDIQLMFATGYMVTLPPLILNLVQILLVMLIMSLEDMILEMIKKRNLFYREKVKIYSLLTNTKGLWL